MSVSRAAVPEDGMFDYHVRSYVPFNPLKHPIFLVQPCHNPTNAGPSITAFFFKKKKRAHAELVGFKTLAGKDVLLTSLGTSIRF